MNSIMELESEIEMVECPYCKSKHFIKYGKFNDIQRYKCKSEKCQKTFSSRTLAPWRYSKKSIQHWHKYMKLMECGSNLRQCAEKIKINLSTSFYWRHKILKVISKINEEVRLNNNVEIVKTIIRENHKGVRGTYKELRRKIVIVSAKDSSNNIFSKAVGSLPCDQRKLEKLIESRINNNSYIKAYLDRTLMAIASKHNNKIVDKERKYSNNIMTYYLNQLAWLHKFKGVSTRHINKYLAWFAMVFNK